MFSIGFSRAQGHIPPFLKHTERRGEFSLGAVGPGSGGGLIEAYERAW